jgi:ATP-dependent DNA helicase RecQ
LSIHEILYQYWGYKQFRPLQEDIIQSILQKKDTLALLPTGGGKSICFQVPAMAMDGLCIVVSPLIALIKDQVENLQKKEIPALMLYSGMPFKQVDNVLKNAINGKYKFLYVSPERLETKLFLEYLPAMELCLIAVDESHCISQWGYDFRPPYLRIAALREQLPNVPILALTASATKIVQQDIGEKLLFKQPNIFQKSFKRPNLSYSIFKVDSKINKTVEILNAVQGTAIVYCKSRRRTKEISDLLRYYNINAAYYNAGLTNDERSDKQQKWINNEIRIMVCTNAFGMGIDKPDVRVVIHYDVPDCVENYYQEAGRAGRDEKKAYAVLLYQDKDLEQLKNQVDIKYPTPEAVKEVYVAVCNYLQITSGSSEGNYYDFDLNHFAKTFKLDVLLVNNSLKILEQEGILTFNESVFLPSTVHIVANRERLRNLEKENFVDSEMVKTILRTYGGVMDYPAIISEKNIAFLTKSDVENIQLRLSKLNQQGVVVYTPVKETPQLYFTQERIHSNNFTINVANYTKRKENYAQKVNAMLDFVQQTMQCKSIFISTYFGVEEKENCGVCDICLGIKRKTIDASEKEKLMQQILTSLQKVHSYTIEDLQRKIFATKKIETIKAALDILLAEEKIIFKEEKIWLKI